ncbi:MAG: hypothetical protein COU46_03000 [Candidatus Niyogibacteria bacterium CG10_big_fil_rev_8_21_14_0_10_42_19]|uniref:Uncharacterized protein n=1 Tax=Candidatus Niyogibacteria bacterium CG10_big_fil_rev_8_21_14_0_10_42_19 TaxID=1974725 RepID=A0A2H0TF81_9BACT|nr:MAG: hypothetical protein COU46_03000 [Candidatus Niyogibacteria bacterium CG10_big_fil_rev_8_21_14_0_10_42_19]
MEPIIKDQNSSGQENTPEPEQNISQIAKLKKNKVLQIALVIIIFVILFLIYSATQKSFPFMPPPPPGSPSGLESFDSSDTGPLVNLGANTTQDIQQDLDQTEVLDVDQELDLINNDLEQL